MFGLFKRHPEKQLRKDLEALRERAFQAQRNGDIRQYSMLTAEAEAVRVRIEDLQKASLP